MQPHEVEGLKPNPDDKNRKRRRTTVLLLAIIAGLLTAIAINLIGRFLTRAGVELTLARRLREAAESKLGPKPVLC